MAATNPQPIPTMLDTIKTDVTDALYNHVNLVSVTPEYNKEDMLKGSCTVVFVSHDKQYSAEFGWIRKFEGATFWSFYDDTLGAYMYPGDLAGILEWFVHECLIRIHVLEHQLPQAKASKT